jgi:Fe-S cluster biogenesis protein NfuA
MKTHKSKIEEILDKVRPYIKMHGGDVRLVDVKNGIVSLKISGACADCPLAELTYNKMVGGLIKQEVPKIKKVIIV